MDLELFGQKKTVKHKKIHTASQFKTTKTPKYAFVLTETDKYTIMETAHVRNKLMLYDNKLIDNQNDPTDMGSDQTFPAVVLAIANS